MIQTDSEEPKIGTTAPKKSTMNVSAAKPVTKKGTFLNGRLY